MEIIVLYLFDNLAFNIALNWPFQKIE